MSTEADDDLGAVALPNIASGRASLWNKTKKVKNNFFLSQICPANQAFTYVWENHREDADWFIKADDDTFVIIENLK